MSLDPGTKLGRYEIRSKLGAGGMGEVYLARDVQLDRMVALKILPAVVARDQQRFHRFLQEARAASSLSHPNVDCNYSPDGKLIACFYHPEQPDRPTQIIVFPAEGGEPVKAFDIPPTKYTDGDGVLRWSPDGRALLYLDSSGGAQNIWSQNLNGGAPKQLTDFKDTEVRTFAFSSDGKKIAMVRFSFRSDVVLIRDFR